MLNRKQCLQFLHSQLKDEIVVATYSSASEWVEISDRALDYYSFGAMGLASSHALGLALAHPNRRVVVLDGDGSLLMNLGTLVTIAAAGPKNLTHFVWHNGSYEANGGHPLPNPTTDFCTMARGAGLTNVQRLDKFDTFQQQLGTLLTSEGPVFAEMMIEQGPLGPRSYDEMYRQERRDRFRAALKG